MIIINSEKPSSHRPLVPPPPPAVSHFPPSTPQNESTATSRAPSDSESEDEPVKTPELEPSNQGAIAVDDGDDFQMDLGSDMETLKDEPAVDIKITPKPPSSRKKTTKPAESKPRVESKSSSKRSRPSSSSKSKSSSSTKTEHTMANTNLKISEILQKTKWLPKLTDNVIKKFELLEEGETIVIKYWIDMPTQTGKVHLLVGMDGRKW